MNNLKSVHAIVRVIFVVVCLQVLALGQTADKIATIAGSGLSVRWDVAVSYSELTLTVAAPDDQVFRKVFKAGSTIEFKLVDAKGEKLPDGQYSYELRLTPQIGSDVKETLAAARAKGNDADVRRDLIKRGVLQSQPAVVSGSFSILNGSVVVAGASEATSRRMASVPAKSRVFRPASGTTPMSGFRLHHPAVNPFFDFVIADDLIVQGSACVGLDCADGENFGFDTIRVKENNDRIQFDDTSTSAGFASNNWQIRANSSASGGGNFLAFVDQGTTGNSETGTIVLEVDAGAPANSVRVSSTGKVGLRTATPVLDIHANTTDTPAIRLEQNNTGGFTAQTWDLAGNEANFFVRDVTSGSRLPFRIRPGAPTSSIDISAAGNVGIGTASPNLRAEVFGGTGLPASSGTTPTGIARFSQTGGTGVIDFGFGGGAGWMQVYDSANLANRFPLLLNPNGGNVGIGTNAPTDLLSVNGTASKPGGGTWAVFSDERLKRIRGTYQSGLRAVMQLQPVRYEYKPNNALGIKSPGEHIGFSAQAVQQVIPEAVTANANGYLMVNNDPIIWTMLNAIKEQQNEIEKLKKEVHRLRATARRRR
ncbi:MAG TPA: tail fiber domain-containing protein [Pyrinomonadaceae bacterium]|nr:tail fiber domain-containing protein [Pyrinomonadaceae bacterium]